MKTWGQLLFLLLWSVELAAKLPYLSLQELPSVRQVSAAVMSPNGKHVAFSLTVPVDPYKQTAPAGHELYLINRRGDLTPLIRGPNTIGQVRWRSDNQALWFIAKRHADKRLSLYEMPIDGGEAVRRLAFSTDILGYDINTQNQHILFWATEAPDEQLQRLEAQGLRPHIVDSHRPVSRLWLFNKQAPPAKIPVQGHVISAQWVPGRDAIVLVIAPTPNEDDVIMHPHVRVINLAGETLQRFDHQGKLGKIRVSPDGEKLAMIGSQDERDPAEGRLLIAELNAPQVYQQLTDFEGHIVDIDWLSDNRVGFVAHTGTGSTVGLKTFAKKAGRARVLRESRFALMRLSVDEKGDDFAVLMHRPEHPRELYWYRGNTFHRMTDSNPWLNERRLADIEVVSYNARDGLRIEGLLAKPDKGEAPYPTLIFVHGGPEAHFSNGWLNRYSHPVTDAVNRGFAVFFPNYRGSTGRGVGFTKLGQQDYAGAEFDDILDGRQYLIDSGIAKADQIGISGTSYGGYAAAWMATRHTEAFAASVAGMGISEQISKFGTTDIPTEMIQLHAIKAPWLDWQILQQRSPVYYSAQAKTPLLLMHGKQDARVHYTQSLILYRFLQMQGNRQTRLVLYPDEGHGFRAPPAQLDYSMRLMRWMDHFILNANTQLPDEQLPHPEIVTPAS